MVSSETVQSNGKTVEPTSSPRISFSADLLNDNDFICINPNSHPERDHKSEKDKGCGADFEFLSGNLTSETMITADELFSEGKLLPFWQIHHSEKLSKISLKTEQDEEKVVEKKVSKEENRMSWFIDDDPSPRPPKCTVLWKELLRLKKQRATSLSPSSSSSSSSSTSSSLDMAKIDEGKEGSVGKEKHVKKIKKGLERTRSGSIRIRPMINVPICTHGKTNALPPLFTLKKGRLER